ncbi:MAG: hypothetical protein H7255_14620 [Ramlibacter sp.]|nr:hypothetical protein [Ramlibacter sp.]
MLGFKSVLAFLWLSTVTATFAAVRVSGTGIDIVLDPTVTGLTCVLSTLSGATALFIRINNLLLKQEEEREDGSEPRKFVRPWLFASAHMSGSWMAGTLMFLVAHANTWDVWYGLMGVVIASFGGATFLEKVAERYLSVVPLGPPGAPKGLKP